MFVDPEADPREGGTSLGDERETLIEFLRGQRLTMQLKCEGLDAEQLASRPIDPSTLSLLGLVRHLAEVERKWFRQRFAGLDVPNRYQSEAEPDGDFDGAVADQAWSMRRGPRGETRSASPSNSPVTQISALLAEMAPANLSLCGSFWST